MLVSDVERERVAVLLREHWLAGRLGLPEFEARTAAALAARAALDDRELFSTLQGLPMWSGQPAPAPAVQSDGGAVAALVLGLVGLILFVVSFGLLALVTVPISATAWGLGRSARRRGSGSRARAGEVLGIIGTVLGVVVLAGCAALVTL